MLLETYYELTEQNEFNSKDMKTTSDRFDNLYDD